MTLNVTPGVRGSCREIQIKKQEMIMTRTLACLVLALTFVAGASVAHAIGNLMVHGYQGAQYGGK
jgi:hypothetical protein